MHYLSSISDFGFESMRSCPFSFLVFMFFRCSDLRCSTFFFFFALSNLQLFRAFVDLRVVFFVLSGFRAFGFHGLRAFGLRVFVFWMLVFPACKLSSFLPFMFSSFRLSFFDISPELSLVRSKFAFVSCVSLLFAVLFVFLEIPNNRFYPCNNHFTRATTIFPHANDHFRNCSVYVCLC